MRIAYEILAILTCASAVFSCSSRDSIRPFEPGFDASTDLAAGDVGQAETAVVDAALADVPDRYAALAAAFEAERIKLGAPGAALAVLEGGQLTFSRGFGLKNPNLQDPVLPTTLFRIGSVTKMMTATALLQQVQAGTVDLNAAVTQYVPELNFTRDTTWAPSIKIQNLLTHSTGLYDYLDINWPDDNDDQLSVFLTGSTFSAAEYLMNPAGAFFNYSNPNFMISGLVVERLGAGKVYRQIMHDGVFAPLGMTRTLFLGSEVQADGDWAYGKVTSDPTMGIVDCNSYDNPWARPAGYAWSSVLDLAKFAQFLMLGNESVLGAAQHQAMTSPQASTKELLDIASYGYGVFITDGLNLSSGWYGIRAVWHDGAIPGYSAFMYTIPALGFGFISLANTDQAAFNNSLVVALQTLVTLPSPTTAPNVSPDTTKFSAYAGSYYDQFNVGRINVQVESNQLQVDAPDLTAAGITYVPVLQPTSLDNFSFTLTQNGVTSAVAVTFIFEEGVSQYFRTRGFVAARTGADSGSAAPLPIKAGSIRLDRAIQDSRRYWNTTPLSATQGF